MKSNLKFQFPYLIVCDTVGTPSAGYVNGVVNTNDGRKCDVILRQHTN
ncbi:MAG: hypothetical protein ICV65_17030 [Flavisolibacter sp.]|nr:hypothetical protein [Flavisolibacter sp.]